jgi:hypothetical protein
VGVAVVTGVEVGVLVVTDPVSQNKIRLYTDVLVKLPGVGSCVVLYPRPQRKIAIYSKGYSDFLLRQLRDLLLEASRFRAVKINKRLYYSLLIYKVDARRDFQKNIAD